MRVRVRIGGWRGEARGGAVVKSFWISMRDKQDSERYGTTLFLYLLGQRQLNEPLIVIISTQEYYEENRFAKSIKKNQKIVSASNKQDFTKKSLWFIFHVILKLTKCFHLQTKPHHPSSRKTSSLTSSENIKTRITLETSMSDAVNSVATHCVKASRKLLRLSLNYKAGLSRVPLDDNLNNKHSSKPLFRLSKRSLKQLSFFRASEQKENCLDGDSCLH